MILSVHQGQYLPWLGYLDKIKKSDCFVFLDKVQYKHREYQNRNKIRTQNGWMWLTVPVISKGLRTQLICDVRIDNTSDWQEEHWRSLKAWYGKAEFFGAYSPFFEEAYTKNKWDKLLDLNIFIIKYLLNELSIETPLYFESDIGISKTKTERIIEICKKLNAETYLSGRGAKDYLDEELFQREGLKLIYQDFKHPVYKQCFARNKEDFIPYMSAIDLLFNEGKKATDILWGEKNEHISHRGASG